MLISFVPYVRSLHQLCHDPLGSRALAVGRQTRALHAVGAETVRSKTFSLNARWNQALLEALIDFITAHLLSRLAY